MVWKSVDRIKRALPEVIHVIMFYNNGIVYQTTFEQNLNIPKIGENLAQLINQLKTIYELCNYTFKDYDKVVIETEEVSCILLKLGEESNIALFFKKELDIHKKLQSIRRYIKKIEGLIDADSTDVDFQELKFREEEVKELEASLVKLKSKINHLDEEQKRCEETELDKQKEIEKEISNFKIECKYIEQQINQKKNEIETIKDKLETERIKLEEEKNV